MNVQLQIRIGIFLWECGKDLIQSQRKNQHNASLCLFAWGSKCILHWIRHSKHFQTGKHEHHWWHQCLRWMYGNASDRWMHARQLTLMESPAWKPVNLKSCTIQLAGVFTNIFNLSLSTSVVPACFTMATIVAVLKSSTITSLNAWWPEALSPIMSKYLE